MQQAWRFALYQHMAYLLLVPLSQTKANLIYKNAITFLRNSYIKHALLNTYFNIKQKLIMLGLIMTPRVVSYTFQRRKNLI